MTHRKSMLDQFPIEIQIDEEDAYTRILLKGITVIEGPRITGKDLEELFGQMGFTVKMVCGMFGGEDDDQYDEFGMPDFIVNNKIRMRVMGDPDTTLLIEID